MTTPLRVLIIDDNAGDAELATRALRLAGYAVESVRVCRSQALIDALSSPWEIVLCDSGMPSFDTAQAVSLVRSVSSSLPILVVTGRQESELQYILSTGTVSGYVSKDHLDDLPAAVRALVMPVP